MRSINGTRPGDRIEATAAVAHQNRRRGTSGMFNRCQRPAGATHPPVNSTQRKKRSLRSPHTLGLPAESEQQVWNEPVPKFAADEVSLRMKC